MTSTKYEEVFPKWVRATLKSIGFCCDHLKEPGIYCIEYPKNLDEELKSLVNGLFSSSFATFIHYKGEELINQKRSHKYGFRNKNSEFDTVMEGKLHPKIEDFIKKKSITQGVNQSLRIVHNEIGDKKTQINIEVEGEKQPLMNDSYKALINSIIAANKALGNIKVICFMIDIGRLDDNFVDTIHEIFISIHEEIIKEEKFLIFFYCESEDFKEKYFTNTYLWSKSIFNNFAIIDHNGARKLASYIDSESLLTKLITQVKNKKTFTLHIGAGASINSGLPPTDTLLLLALKELLKISQEDMTFLKEKYCEKFRFDLSHDKITLEHVMSTMMKNEIDLPTTDAINKFKNMLKKAILSSGYQLLKSISTKYRIIMTTTNIDDLCDKSIDNPTILLDKDEYELLEKNNSLQKDKFNIISKIHGDVNKTPIYLGLSLETTMELKQWVKNFFTSLLRGKHVSDDAFYYTFIGYNFADPDILKALTDESKKQTGCKFIPIIVTPNSSITIEKFINNWPGQSAKPHQINMSFDKFIEEINIRLIDN